MAEDTADAPLHVQKKVEKLQSDLVTAKDKVVADAKIPAIPHQQSDPDPAPNAEANKPAVGKREIRVDDN